MSPVDGQRRRLTAVLFTGAALGTTGSIAATTVASLAAAELAGSAGVAGVPGAAATLGTAARAGLLTVGVFARRRRRAFLTGYGLGAAGALAALAATAAGSLPGLVAALAFVGFGNAANQIARFANADIAPAARKAGAVSLVVWAGTIGSVAGPALIAPAGTLAADLGWRPAAGGLLVAAATMGAALLLQAALLRPDPATLTVDPVAAPAGDGVDAFRLPAVRTAAVAIAGAQAVMILVMTATPVHLAHGGAGLGGVGAVMSAHTLGMFAFSPLTGRLADRVGAFPVLVAGFGVEALAVAVATLPVPGTALPGVALFLLGFGWNLAFVAGSAFLADAAAGDTAVQGRVDTVTWSASAVVSLGSGLLLRAGGYRAVTLTGLGLVVAVVAVVLRRRTAPVPAA